MKILLLDDDYGCIKAVYHLLRKVCKNCEIEMFTNPELCIEHYISSEMPDIIISDFRMPGIDGEQFIRTMEFMGFEGKSFIVSGWSGLDPLESHADGIFTKPVNAEDFRQVLAACHV